VETARKYRQGWRNETWGSEKLKRGSGGIGANPTGGCYGSLSGAKPCMCDVESWSCEGNFTVDELR